MAVCRRGDPERDMNRAEDGKLYRLTLLNASYASMADSNWALLLCSKWALGWLVGQVIVCPPWGIYAPCGALRWHGDTTYAV